MNEQQKPKRVLVTGGTGFVGSHLIEHLRDQGDSVRALVRPTSNRSFVESLGADSVIGDLDDSDSLRRACDGCEVVYHAAARVEFAGAEEAFYRTTVDGTARLLAAAAVTKVRRFVYVSSCAVYHPDIFTSHQDINEFTPTPELPRWFRYGRAKHQAECIVRDRCPADMEWVIVRLGYIYGPRDSTMHAYIEPAMRDSTMRIVGDGRNTMYPVYVGDTARALVRAGRCPEAAGKILIAGCTEHITQQQYFDAMAEGFGIAPIRKHIPYKIAFFFGWLGERLIRSGPRLAVMQRASIATVGLPQNIRCDYTQKLLDWKPEVKFTDGIRKAFEWYHAEYDREYKGTPP